MTRSNLLLITADQWRGECLSSLGHPVVQTPRLDELARDGVTFTNHFAQCIPCGPSRTSIYTGMYLQNHRMTQNGVPLDARHTNIALEMRKLGFRPALAGYTDITPDPRDLSPHDPALTTYEGILPGIDRVLCMPSTAFPEDWARWLQGRGIALPDDLTELYTATVEDYPGAAGRGPTFAPTRCRSQDSESAFVAATARDYLRVPGARPWFLHVSFLAPHPPYLAPEPFNRMYSSEAVAAPVLASSPAEEGRIHTFLDMLIRLNLDGDSYLNATHLPRTETVLRQLRATYYGLMTHVDEHIGSLVDVLKETGQYDDTLIVFVSDHGEHLGDHYLVGKDAWYDSAFHVPLIVKAPGREWVRGGRVAAFSENVDLLPTVLDLYGAEIPRQCDGRSLRPFLAGAAPPDWRTEAHWEIDFRRHWIGGLHPPTHLGLPPDACVLNVLRGPRYKYVHFAALPPLLFDLADDPHECRNLAADPAHVPVVLECAQKLLSWRMRNDERTLTHLEVGPEGLTPG